MPQIARETGDERSETSGYESSGGDTVEQQIVAGRGSVGDSAAAVDTLGFEIYVNAIADFLVAPNTHAPLTCSIEGPWGSGKSSFMLQLKNRLTGVAPDCRTIEFNAWKYDKQEELWAAFALKVTRSLRERMRRWERVCGEFRLFRARIKGWGERLSLLALVLTWLLLLTGSGGVVVWTVHASHSVRVSFIKSLVGAKEPNGPQPPASGQPPANLEPWYEWLSWSPLATAAILIVLLIGKIPESFRKRLFEAQLETYIDKPDYKGKAAFVDAFSDDFSRVIKAYAPRKGAKIFVFIDDLDRCEAPKAADLMQAINLMIGDGNPLIFILGLDRAKVASAIAFKYREIIPYLEPSLESGLRPEGIRGFGDTFLEKFIQLSFRLPVSSNELQARKFVDSLITDAALTVSEDAKNYGEPDPGAAAESERRALRIESGAESERIREVVMMVREVVEYSPRRIKTFLNGFRLALYLASSQGLLDIDGKTDESEVTPERLGKYLVLTTRYPELRAVIDRDPTFLFTMEKLVLGFESKPLTAQEKLARSWLQKPGLAKLMAFGMVDKTWTTAWSRRYSMENFPVGKFDTILPSAPLPSGGIRDAVKTSSPADPSTDGSGSAADTDSLQLSSAADAIPDDDFDAPEQPSEAPSVSELADFVSKA